MSAFSTYSTTAAANVNCAGINIGENCPAANMNDVVRQILAEGKQLNSLVVAIDTSTLMPKSGGTFTAPIYYTGSGAYRYNANSSHTSGAEYFLPVGSARPSPAEGVKVYYY